MKYDFTSIIDRKGKDAIAVDNIGKKLWGNEPEAPKEGFDPIPMWVADMNFGTAPAVTDAIIARAQHPTFGYYETRDEYFDGIINWQTNRNGHKGLTKECIGYENGVHGFVTSAVSVLSAPGDYILLHSPVYVGFWSDVEGIGRNSVYSELKRDENGVWRMDYEDMDAKLKAYNIHLAIFCSPHNPTGRVWEKWEIENVVNLCGKLGVKIVSDEIWADFVVDPDCKHIPTQSVSDLAKEIVTANYAPSKTFNLAGLQGSYSVTYNKQMRDKIDKIGSTTHSNAVSLLTLEACIGAYTGGAEYVDEMLKYVRENQKLMVDYFNTCEGVSVDLPQGTYVLWVNFDGLCEDVGVIRDQLREVGVITTDGRGFHGKTYLRFNCACPRANCEKAIKAMKKVFKSK